MDFYVALQHAVATRADVRIIHPDEIVAEFPDQSFAARNPFALRVKLSDQGVMREVGLIPDLVFGLRLADGSRRCFMVEIDRGTMPIVRSNPTQTSFERKMRVYLAAHAAKQHERHFGWKTFRVLTVTTDQHRVRSMMEHSADFTSLTVSELRYSFSLRWMQLMIRLGTRGRTAPDARFVCSNPRVAFFAKPIAEENTIAGVDARRLRAPRCFSPAVTGADDLSQRSSGFTLLGRKASEKYSAVPVRRSTVTPKDLFR